MLRSSLNSSSAERMVEGGRRVVDNGESRGLLVLNDSQQLNTRPVTVTPPSHNVTTAGRLSHFRQRSGRAMRAAQQPKRVAEA